MEVPQHVGELEYTTPARVPMWRRSKGARGVQERLRSPDVPRRPPSPPTTPESALSSLLSGDGALGDDSQVSTVVREAVDSLLLNVIKQLQHDLTHGPAQTRSKIATQFLPRIMRLLDKEEAEDKSQLEELREEMNRLNHELLHGEPRLYTPLSTATPDDEDLPVVDPTGVTVEVDQPTGG